MADTMNEASSLIVINALLFLVLLLVKIIYKLK